MSSVYYKDPDLIATISWLNKKIHILHLDETSAKFRFRQNYTNSLALRETVLAYVSRVILDRTPFLDACSEELVFQMSDVEPEGLSNISNYNLRKRDRKS